MAEISYKPVEPIFGKGFQDKFSGWLFSKFFADEGAAGGYPQGVWQGLGYPGAVTPDINQTRLPDVYKSWQPWGGGTSYLADYFANNRGGIGTPDPRLQAMIQGGGTGGPGNAAMNLMMQYGAPSQAGQYAGSMAQWGASSPGLATRLADIANNSPSSAAQYLLPFLQAQTYRAPGVFAGPPAPVSGIPRRA